MLLLLGNVLEQSARLVHVGAHSDGLAARVDAHAARAADHLLVQRCTEKLRPAAIGAGMRSRRADDHAASGKIHAAAQCRGCHQHTQNASPKTPLDDLSLLGRQPLKQC